MKKEKIVKKSPFVKIVEAFLDGDGHEISVNGNQWPHWVYQLVLHKRDLALASKGLKINRMFKLKDYKEFYGLKGRSGEDVYVDFIESVWNRYAVHLGFEVVTLKKS